MVNISKGAKRIIEENPVAFVKVVSGNQVLITDNCMRQTKENLRKNKNVCLAVWDKKWIGKARYYTNGKWKKFVEEMPENKGLAAKGAILITASNIIHLK